MTLYCAVIKVFFCHSLRRHQKEVTLFYEIFFIVNTGLCKIIHKMFGFDENNVTTPATIT